MTAHSILMIFGIMCGIAYAILGVVAAKHMNNPTYFEKYIGWSLWWFLERKKYNEQGKKYCNIGMILAVAGAASWTLYFTN
ncbi:hypothetical protein [Microcoleus sp. ARI1-A3]|uniref:hypothetical protein n=1 Tax=Microcoleus sp. ARI1-A3 TaxID=2818558 RepID=UPI002FCFCE4E